jgi:hypothetical protein
MDKDNFIDFAIDNLAGGTPISFYQFMFRNINYVEQMDLDGWLLILEQIKNRPLALYSFLPFTYKFVGINLIDQFLSFKDIAPDTMHYIKDSLDGDYRFLCLSSMDVSLLKGFEGVIDKLLNLKSKLISQGGASRG